MDQRFVAVVGTLKYPNHVVLKCRDFPVLKVNVTASDEDVDFGRVWSFDKHNLICISKPTHRNYDTKAALHHLYENHRSTYDKLHDFYSKNQFNHRFIRHQFNHAQIRKEFSKYYDLRDEKQSDSLEKLLGGYRKAFESAWSLMIQFFEKHKRHDSDGMSVCDHYEREDDNYWNLENSEKFSLLFDGYMRLLSNSFENGKYIGADIQKMIYYYAWPISIKSMNCIASTHLLGNIINDFLNDESNKCESNDTNFFLQCIYVKGGALRDSLLLRDIKDVDMGIDIHQLSKLYLKHLQLYHSDMEKNKSTKCVFWRHYLNKFNRRHISDNERERSRDAFVRKIFTRSQYMSYGYMQWRNSLENFARGAMRGVEKDKKLAALLYNYEQYTSHSDYLLDIDFLVYKILKESDEYGDDILVEFEDENDSEYNNKGCCRLTFDKIQYKGFNLDGVQFDIIDQIRSSYKQQFDAANDENDEKSYQKWLLSQDVNNIDSIIKTREEIGKDIQNYELLMQTIDRIRQQEEFHYFDDQSFLTRILKMTTKDIKGTQEKMNNQQKIHMQQPPQNYYDYGYLEESNPVNENGNKMNENEQDEQNEQNEQNEPVDTLFPVSADRFNEANGYNNRYNHNRGYHRGYGRGRGHGRGHGHSNGYYYGGFSQYGEAVASSVEEVADKADTEEKKENVNGVEKTAEARIEASEVGIQLPIYPFPLDLYLYDFTVNTLHINLESVLKNDSCQITKNNQDSIDFFWNIKLRKFNRKYVTNTSDEKKDICFVDKYLISKYNEKGVEHIENKLITMPNLDVVNESNVDYYFWRFVKICEKFIYKLDNLDWTISPRVLTKMETFYDQLPRMQSFNAKLVSYSVKDPNESDYNVFKTRFRAFRHIKFDKVFKDSLGNDRSLRDTLVKYVEQNHREYEPHLRECMQYFGYPKLRWQQTRQEEAHVQEHYRYSDDHDDIDDDDYYSYLQDEQRRRDLMYPAYGNEYDDERSAANRRRQRKRRNNTTEESNNEYDNFNQSLFERKKLSKLLHYKKDDSSDRRGRRRRRNANAKKWKKVTRDVDANKDKQSNVKQKKKTKQRYLKPSKLQNQSSINDTYDTYGKFKFSDKMILS